MKYRYNDGSQGMRSANRIISEYPTSEEICSKPSGMTVKKLVTPCEEMKPNSDSKLKWTAVEGYWDRDTLVSCCPCDDLGDAG